MFLKIKTSMVSNTDQLNAHLKYSLKGNSTTCENIFGRKHSFETLEIYFCY